MGLDGEALNPGDIADRLFATLKEWNGKLGRLKFQDTGIEPACVNAHEVPSILRTRTAVNRNAPVHLRAACGVLR